MNCERCQQDLEDLAYGELPSAGAAAVRSHLSECALCQSAQERLETEREIFSRYQEQSRLEPTLAMWEGIQARIRREPPTAAARAEWGPGRGWREAVASAWESAGISAVFRPAVLRQVIFAAVLIAVSVTATVILLRERRGEDKNLAVKQTPTVEVSPSPSSSREPAINPPVVREQKRPATAPASTSPAAKTPPRKVGEQELITNQLARAEREYRSAIRLLDGAIAKRKETLDPTVFEHYQSSLALIDKSIEESRQALRQNPADAAAGQFLLAAYSRKVELMQEIAMQ
jgi:hypothetical protein